MTGAGDRQAGVAALARPTRDINHVIAYGQSLAMGCEGWPALSLTQPHDSLMLGGSVRPRDVAAPAWQPVGAAAFRPLVATVQSDETGETLTAEAVAALPPGHIAPGETVLEGAVNLFRGRLAAAHGRLLASATGVGGRSIEMLSRGAHPELFNRLRGCATLARQTAAAEGLSYGVLALLFLQGEHNALGAEGCTSDRDTYGRLLAALHRDMLDAAAAIAGPAAPPGLFLYQTGGAYANEGNSIAQAQLDFALATPGCFMVGPSYPVTEKHGHLDANGYRWLGAQFGKVMHRVLTLGQDFRPLHPLRATLAGRVLRVTFHVPVPPLAWGRPFAGQSYIDPLEGGFTVIDAAGEAGLVALERSGPDSVELTLGRDPVGAATLRYADCSRGGRGILRDSDNEVAADAYLYDPATGHYETADHPELNGRPYPLHNWCVAFAIPVQAIPVQSIPPPPAAPAVRTPAPPGRPGDAWDALRTTRTDVTGARLPARTGWLARLGRALSGGGAVAPAPAPPVAPAALPPVAPAPVAQVQPVAAANPAAEAPTEGFGGFADLTFASTGDLRRFGRSGGHERVELFAPEAAPPQRPAHDEARLPPEFAAEHHGIAAPGPVAAYAVAGAVLWSTGLVTLGRRFVAPPDCMPGYFRASLGPGAPPLAPVHAGAIGRADLRTVTLDRPVAVATHPNLRHGHMLLEMLPRLWLAAVLRARGADIPLALSTGVPDAVKGFARLLHREDDIVWYDGAAERLRAPAVVLPGMLHSAHNFHPAMNRMVADLVQRAGPPDAVGPTRIYLAEPGFGDEHMRNAAEVEDAMDDLGFVAMRLADLDAAQQVRLFAGARIVVAEYAEALHAALFCAPGTRVVAINFATVAQSAIARLRGHEIAYVPPADGRFRHWRLSFGLSRTWDADVAAVRRVVGGMVQGIE